MTLPSLFPELTPETPALDIAPEPQAPARATYRCAGPCRGSYVFDAPGRYCYWCKRNGHDETPATLERASAPPAPAGPTQDHPRGPHGQE